MALAIRTAIWEGRTKGKGREVESKGGREKERGKDKSLNLTTDYSLHTLTERQT